MRIAGNTVKKVNGHFNNTTDAGIMSMSTCKRYSQMTQKITKAVFPVAGLGTRFLPATKASPKEMLPDPVCRGRSGSSRNHGNDIRDRTKQACH